MGKIRLQDLAKMMGVPPQDLMFKLKSIGVRVEGEDAHIDTDIIQAILQGKKLPHPREVILRDEPNQAEAASPAARRRRPAARRPSPLRPNRPRTMIKKVDSDIQTLPSKDKMKESKPTPEEKAVAEVKAKEAAAAKEKEAEAAKKKAEEAKKKVEEASEKKEAKKAAKAARKAKKAADKAEKEAQEAATAAAKAAIPEPVKISSPPPEFGEEPEEKDKKKKKKDKKEKKAKTKAKAEPEETEEPEEKETKEKKKPRRAAKKRSEEDEEELKTRRGAAAEDFDEDEEESRPSAPRRKRRAERRQRGREEAETVQLGNRAITFHKGRPQGPVLITEGTTVRDFADKLGIKSKDLIALLVSQGVMANINQVLDVETAVKLAEEMGVEAMEVSIEEEIQLRQEHEAETEGEAAGKTPRGPVVTIMGHVDHGKTSLLDAIRESRVTEGEHGGITQHIGAYQVTKNDRKIVFLDTPGHEAFTMMRARGAGATDLVVLVVAADDGVMPQTVEAIDHARAAEVPLVVAINKIDKPNANLDRVKKELADHELLVEDWGGDTVAVPISALERTGIDELLEMILLTADLLELKGNPELPAQGVVLEARKEAGRGIVATVLVQNGTLEVGDVFVSGAAHGRVRAMNNDLGERVEEAAPATPVEVTGFNDVPEAGDVFQVVESESEARDIAGYRQQEQRRRELQPTAGRLSLEQLYDKIEEGEVKELPVVLKADVQGSVEVLKDTLAKLGTDAVRVKVIHAQVGAISTNDVILATASDAIILGFNVRPERKASELAEKEGIDIRLHTVIYELTDELKKAMAGLLEPEYREVVDGHAEVRDTFKVPKIGIAAGCHVSDGTVSRNSLVRLLRDNVVVYDGKVASLRRFKDDVAEVRAGFECGIGLERFQDIKPGDVVEAYHKEEVTPEL